MNDERLDRALAAPVAPAKDLHFTLMVMQRAEAERFRTDALRRGLVGAGAAGLAGAIIFGLSGWIIENTATFEDLALAGGALLAVVSLLGALRRAAPARAAN